MNTSKLVKFGGELDGKIRFEISFSWLVEAYVRAYSSRNKINNKLINNKIVLTFVN